MNKYILKKYRLFTILGFILIPIFFSMFIISLHSTYLIKRVISILILLIVIFLLYSLVIIFINRKKIDRKTSTLKKALLIVFVSLNIIINGTGLFLLYSNVTGFSDFFVTSAMTTQHYKFVARIFYNDKEIEIIRARNIVEEDGSSTNKDLIDINSKNIEYKNKYEKQILERNKNEKYKIIDIKGKNLVGKLAVIYDPSKVVLGVSKGMGTLEGISYGEYVYEITKRENAVIGINASGYLDYREHEYGGVPFGMVIKNNKLLTYVRKTPDDIVRLVGFSKDNKLILSYNLTKEEALDTYRDAIEFGPFLIVNGKKATIKGNGGWGYAPRTVIGQRQDGIVLFLVMDGRQKASVGASMKQVTDIMWKYGAYNAANLDGGTSSSMVLNNKIITNPVNDKFQNKTRTVPNAWIVKR